MGWILKLRVNHNHLHQHPTTTQKIMSLSIILLCNVCTVHCTVYSESFLSNVHSDSFVIFLHWLVASFDCIWQNSYAIVIHQYSTNKNGFCLPCQKKCTFRTLNVTDKVNVLVLQWGHLVAQIVYNKRNCWNLPQIGTLPIGERWKHVCRCTPSLECYCSHSV